MVSILLSNQKFSVFDFDVGVCWLACHVHFYAPLILCSCLHIFLIELNILMLGR